MTRSTRHDQTAQPSGRGRRLFAALYDPITAAAERTITGRHRAELLTQAAGTVLEIGAGTGANLAHYRPGQISRLVLVEPDPHMRRRLQTKLAHADPALRARTEVLAGAAEQLPLADRSVDVVVSTLVLCSVTHPPQAVREITRVLRPTGRLLFLEHVRAGHPASQRWQTRLTPLQRRLAGGCHLDRDTLPELRAAGLHPDQVRAWAFPGPLSRLLPVTEGSATPGQ